MDVPKVFGISPLQENIDADDMERNFRVQKMVFKNW
jgi:hypothetical protein